jgi:pimeloyl-ACP methyl ester carboxylesterase
MNYIHGKGYRNVILVGHSLGSAIILAYALRHPKEVCGLILVGAAAKFRASLYVTMELLERALNGDEFEWRESFVGCVIFKKVG